MAHLQRHKQSFWKTTAGWKEWADLLPCGRQNSKVTCSESRKRDFILRPCQEFEESLLLKVQGP